MRKVFLDYTPGCCWRRLLDLEMIKKWLVENDIEIVDRPERADRIFLMTCAFVKEAEDAAVDLVKGYWNDFKYKLIVLGCLVGISPERLDEVYPGDRANTQDLWQLNHLGLRKLLDVRQNDASGYIVQEPADRRSFWKYLLTLNGIRNLWLVLRSGMGFKRKLYFIRPSWGCDMKCTFCVETKAIGKHVSKDFYQLLNELPERNKPLAIIGDNLAAYKSLWATLPHLLQSILNLGYTIANIDSINPHYLIRDLEFYTKLVKTRKIKSIMTALQSGSDRILKKMNRGYTGGDFIRACRVLKKAYPGLVLITQIIVGYPGETLQDLRETCNAVILADITNVVVFRYSDMNNLGQNSNEEVAEAYEFARHRLQKAGILTLHFESRGFYEA